MCYHCVTVGPKNINYAFGLDSCDKTNNAIDIWDRFSKKFEKPHGASYELNLHCKKVRGGGGGVRHSYTGRLCSPMWTSHRHKDKVIYQNMYRKKCTV